MPSDIRQQFGRRLRELRRKAGYTQQQLAELAELDYKHLQQLESNHSPYPRLDTLDKLAKAFKITPSKLLDF